MLIDKVLREGVPITRIVEVDGVEMKVQAMAQLPPGRGAGLPRPHPASLAVLVEPWLIRRNVVRRGSGRACAGCRRRPPLEIGGVAIEGAQTKGTMARRPGAQRHRHPQIPRPARLPPRSCIAVLLWLVGLYLRPDFWGSLDNSFNLILAFTEVALLSIGLTFVIANGDIDLSVGSVLAHERRDRRLL